MSTVKSTRNLSETLYNIAVSIINGSELKTLIDSSNEILDKITPEDVVILFDKLIESDYQVETLKLTIGKLFNVFYKHLKKFRVQFKNNNSFIDLLIQENKQIQAIFKELIEINREINKSKKNSEDFVSLEYREDLLVIFKKLENMETHYLKKENILFPGMEKKKGHFFCLSLMWSFHDDIRKSYKALLAILNNSRSTILEYNKKIGEFFFLVQPMILREETVIFPIALTLFNKTELDHMKDEGFGFGYGFIKMKKDDSTSILKKTKISKDLVELNTGSLNLKQLIGIFNNLPVDITFVNEQDTVVFYSDPPHRIFPRSRSVIGRKVQNCHPPESVGRVLEILDSFKNGSKEFADFRINVGKKYILIQYYAVKSDIGEYIGTLEVSQEITNVVKLKGEKKLLDWK